MKTNRLARLDQIERVYLIFLRLGVLALASICLLGALYFAGDAVWRVFVSTEVPVEETVVAPSEVSAAMRAMAADRQPQDSEGPSIPAHVRQAHTRFMREAFPAYYAVYQTAARAYNKEEDDLLTAEQLADRLGYSLETYAAGESFVTKAFVENPAYQSQVLAAVTAAMSDQATVALLSQYRDAQRVQSCTTRNVRRTVRQTCGYYYVWDCSYVQTVPVRECEQVYPDGIVSPLAAFTSADQAFGELWMQRAAQREDAARMETGRRHAMRAQIGPKLMLAMQILGGFLVIMFFFLLVAIERHLRSMSAPAESAALEDETGTAEAEPAEA